jgi:hypothetical protein
MPATDAAALVRSACRRVHPSQEAVWIGWTGRGGLGAWASQTVMEAMYVRGCP